MLSRMLSHLGMEVGIVILQNEVEQTYEGTLFNLGEKKTGKDSMTRRFLRARKLRAFLKREKFDFVIDHRPKNQLSREIFYDRYVYKGIRKIYVVHSAKKSTYFTENPQRMAEIYSKNYATVAVSRYIETDLLNELGIHNTYTIHNAFDPAWTEQQGSLPDELLEKEYFLWYGRIVDSIKDLSFLITSFNESEVWRKDKFLVILGDGPDAAGMKEFAGRMDARDHIIFITHTAKPFPFVKHAIATLLTSHYEGFPMVLVESLSGGTPVISLDIKSGPSEIVIDGENGLLVSKRNIPLFAEAIRAFQEDKSLYERCKANARGSVHMFSEERIAQKWSELFQ
jgi:glycosyltransferase involved in cell wall biosynthesis